MNNGARIGKAIHITGVVQGVGFRPFVYNLARQHGLAGWVQNTSAGVDIRAEGPPEPLGAFLAALQAQAPPLARIDSLTAADQPPEGFNAFEIRYSAALAGAFQPISPDIAICPDCLRELRDPSDRRYRYPFINCTNCGPRFTIITDIPYDRPLTTMADFDLCPACEAEYHDPANRRFHAQPVACPSCGPQVWLEACGGEIARGDRAIRRAAALLHDGAILAIKGLGGFHLACDASNATAVAELRRRKGRDARPFALMLADLAAIRQHCHVSEAEARLLCSPASPIVLLRRRSGATIIADAVAPGQHTLGVMLPYTPLHVLLLEAMPPLVMTSGNLSEEPILTGNAEARDRLAGLADAFLMHDRAIHIRTDDSVLRLVGDAELPLRRSRGYAPYPVRLPRSVPPLLAVGGELKNTFCLTRDGYAFMSHHIGDMANYDTLRSFEDGIRHFERLFRIEPQLIVHDLHPDYLATRYAQARAAEAGLLSLAVQHHHAHIAACLAEHAHPGDRPVIGVCFDGTGYGTDGTIWGGEFLLADYHTFTRAAHLRALPLPGGDAATRKPARIALAYLLACGIEPGDDLPPLGALSPVEQGVIRQQVAAGLNTPLTSSMGRLFDAVAALLGVCQVATYEGQAAIELEALAETAVQEAGMQDAYTFALAEALDPAGPHPGAQGAPVPLPEGEGLMTRDSSPFSQWGRGKRPQVAGGEGTTAANPFPDSGAIALDPAAVLRQVISDYRAGVPPALIAARFHVGVAQMVVETCRWLRAQHGLEEVALSGGVFQNVTLLNLTMPRLQAAGFTVYTHRLVPPNDGGLALGQAMIGAAHLNATVRA